MDKTFVLGGNRCLREKTKEHLDEYETVRDVTAENRLPPNITVSSGHISWPNWFLRGLLGGSRSHHWDNRQGVRRERASEGVYQPGFVLSLSHRPPTGFLTF